MSTTNNGSAQAGVHSDLGVSCVGCYASTSFASDHLPATDRPSLFDPLQRNRCGTG